MARGIGRPMAVLVLSNEERSYLERQARRRRVARSLSDRCHMILRCADGLTNKAVAIELGVHECCSARGLRADRRDKLLKWIDTGGQNCTPNNTGPRISMRARGV